MSFFRKLFGGGGIGGGIEKLFTGSDYGRTLKDIYNSGGTTGASGTALTDEGIGNLRSLSGDYKDYIAAGGLTPALRRSFDVAKGGLADQYARSGRSLSAALQARRAQSGGALTPAAIAEMESEGATKANEDYFSASNDLNAQQANLSYSATKDWYSQLQDIQNTITTTGLTREQQGLLARLQAAQLMYQRNKAISDAASKWGGMFMGGGGGG